MTAEEWWTVLIKETFVRAGVEEGGEPDGGYIDGLPLDGN
jgi:hypothetical protein